METQEPSPVSFYARHEFLIRRLHSLSGLVPVGAFVVFHLALNFTVELSPELFQTGVDSIHVLGAALWIVEWLFIFLPLLFHGIVGLWIVSEANYNTTQYRYGNNVRYMLQRITGVIAFVFIFYHVFHMHHYGELLSPFLGEGVGGQFDPHPPYAAGSAAVAVSPIWVKIVYAVGMLSTVFHLANGVWTFGITWGLWTTPAAQKRADYIALGLGLLLAFFGLGSLWGLSNPKLIQEGRKHLTDTEEAGLEAPPPESEAVEEVMGDS